MELCHKTGEHVVYKKHGVYEIADIKTDKICGTEKTYYVLRSVYDSNATVYVPADCEALVSQMELPLTASDINCMIDSSKEAQMEWIDTAAERREFFEDIMNSCDLSRIVAMMRLLIRHKEEALASKAKTFAHDERMLAASQKLVAESFAYSLGIDKKEVVAYIDNRIKREA